MNKIFTITAHDGIHPMFSELTLDLTVADEVNHLRNQKLLDDRITKVQDWELELTSIEVASIWFLDLYLKYLEDPNDQENIGLMKMNADYIINNTPYEVTGIKFSGDLQDVFDYELVPLDDVAAKQQALENKSDYDGLPQSIYEIIKAVNELETVIYSKFVSDPDSLSKYKFNIRKHVYDRELLEETVLPLKSSDPEVFERWYEGDIVCIKQFGSDFVVKWKVDPYMIDEDDRPHLCSVSNVMIDDAMMNLSNVVFKWYQSDGDTVRDWYRVNHLEYVEKVSTTQFGYIHWVFVDKNLMEFDKEA